MILNKENSIIELRYEVANKNEIFREMQTIAQRNITKQNKQHIPSYHVT